MMDIDTVPWLRATTIPDGCAIIKDFLTEAEAFQRQRVSPELP
jgi:hypothetical protein